MRIEELKEEIDNWLRNYFKDKGGFDKVVYDSMAYSLNAGGKRIRPLLAILTYLIYKDDYKKILPAACAIEMIHTYSLIHDDLPCMDNDDLRRGKPTNHKVFGFPIAVLAGDGLLNEAGNILFDFCLKNDNYDYVKACSIIYKAAGVGGMVGGQVVDIMSTGKSISEDELEYMYRKKTGALIKAPIIAGAVMGGADKSGVDTLDKFGDKLGLAFQIQDDILDVIGDTKILGKTVGSDSNNNKTTFVTLFGIEECKKICAKLSDECVNLLESIKGDTSYLIQITHKLLVRQF